MNEYTLWTSVVDLQNLQFYFRTFGDQTLHSVDVRKALVATNGQITQLPMETNHPTPIVPVTAGER